MARMILTLALAVTSVVLVGCGESPLQSVSPVAPSPLVDGSQFAADARTSATNDESGVFHTLDDDEDSDGDGPDRNNEVEIDGVIGTATGDCPGRSFTVGTRNVKASALTVFRNGACSNLRTGARVKVKGRRAAATSIGATRIEFKETELDDEAEVEGVVAVATSGCPTGSFTVAVGTRNVVVRTNGLTLFRDGVCNDLRTLGRRVEAKGRRAADGSIDATRVKFDREDEDEEDEEDSDLDSDD